MVPRPVSTGLYFKTTIMSRNYDYYREEEYQDYYERLLEEREIYNQQQEADRLNEKICKPQTQLPKSQKPLLAFTVK